MTSSELITSQKLHLTPSPWVRVSTYGFWGDTNIWSITRQEETIRGAATEVQVGAGGAGPGWAQVGGETQSDSPGPLEDRPGINVSTPFYFSSFPPLLVPHFISFIELWHKVFLR